MFGSLQSLIDGFEPVQSRNSADLQMLQLAALPAPCIAWMSAEIDTGPAPHRQYRTHNGQAEGEMLASDSLCPLNRRGRRNHSKTLKDLIRDRAIKLRWPRWREPLRRLPKLSSWWQHSKRPSSHDRFRT